MLASGQLMAGAFCFLEGGAIWWGKWGRKDAFPGADGSTTTQERTYQNATTIPIYGADGTTKLPEDGTGYRKISITTAGVLNGNTSKIYSIKFPLTIITSSSDWYTNNQNFQNDALWNDGSLAKSNYDPCPKGWITPPDGTWGDFSITTFLYYIQGKQITSGNNTCQNGRVYDNIAWYPAAGHRPCTGGLLAHVGYSGYYWSSTADIVDTGACRINFNMSTIDRLTKAPNRGQGFSIRCIQE